MYRESEQTSIHGIQDAGKRESVKEMWLCPIDKHKTTYAIIGKKLCRNIFAAVVQLNTVNVNQHAEVVSQTTNVAQFTPSLSLRRKGIISVQNRVTIAFPDRYAGEHAMICPTGQGFRYENHIQWI